MSVEDLLWIFIQDKNNDKGKTMNNIDSFVTPFIASVFECLPFNQIHVNPNEIALFIHNV
jgi:hypothetical protein